MNLLSGVFISTNLLSTNELTLSYQTLVLS